MLISALCDYYNVLEKEGKILPDAYSRTGISYLISLTDDGEIDGIIDCRNIVQTVRKKKNGEETVKEDKRPREMVLPRRDKTPAVHAYIIDHRPDYIFGLACGADGKLTEESPNDKIKRSHRGFAKKNASLFQDAQSPVCRAFYRFVTGWDPSKETKNHYLAELCRTIKKELNTSGFAFCLSGRPDVLLHEDEEAKRLWEDEYEQTQAEKDSSMKKGFCSVYGTELPIPEIHDGVKFSGGGMNPKIICQNSESEWSYGQKRSVGSSVSNKAMKQYTKALDYLLSDPAHSTKIGDTIVVHWAASGNDACDRVFKKEIGLSSEEDDILSEDGSSLDELDKAVSKAVKGAVSGTQPVDTDSVTESLEDETFYIVGLGLNKTRIISRLVYRDSFGKIMKNISAHQNDMRVRENSRPIPLWAVEKELVSPKAKDKKVSTRMNGEIMNAVIKGSAYPAAMYRTVLSRIQTDKDTESNGFIKINNTRLGILKGYINRKNRKKGKKEEIKMALDTGNTSQPYLCGRLFAVLESIQYQASEGSLNKTIRDTYFDKVSKSPGRYLPKLISLSNHHIDKKNMALAEAERNNIIAMFGENGGSFPQKLNHVEQGEFIIGYAQQKNTLIEKAVKAKKENEAKRNAEAEAKAASADNSKEETA